MAHQIVAKCIRFFQSFIQQRPRFDFVPADRKRFTVAVSVRRISRRLAGRTATPNPGHRRARQKPEQTCAEEPTIPLSALWGGEGRGPLRRNGRVRWAPAEVVESPTSPRPSPPPKGGEGVFGGPRMRVSISRSLLNRRHRSASTATLTTATHRIRVDGRRRKKAPPDGGALSGLAEANGWWSATGCFRRWPPRCSAGSCSCRSRNWAACSIPHQHRHRR